MRSMNEKQKTVMPVEVLAESMLPTEFGSFRLLMYKAGEMEVPVLIKGNVSKGSVLTRIHSACFTGETLFSQRCDCRAQLLEAMQRIQDEKEGIIIYLPQEGRGIGLVNKVKAYDLQDRGHDTFDANLLLGFPADKREYAAAAAILNHLNTISIRLLTNSPDKVRQLQQWLAVEQVSLQTEPNEHNKKYLQTKKTKFHHEL